MGQVCLGAFLPAEEGFGLNLDYPGTHIGGGAGPRFSLRTRAPVALRPPSCHALKPPLNPI